MTKKQIIAKYEPVIDEYLHHRNKAIKRRREIELQRLDNEWGIIDEGTIHTTYNEMIPGTFGCIGNYRKQKERQAKYEKWVWRALWVLCGILLLTSLFI